MSALEMKLAVIFALFGVTFTLRWIFGRGNPSAPAATVGPSSENYLVPRTGNRDFALSLEGTLAAMIRTLSALTRPRHRWNGTFSS